MPVDLSRPFKRVAQTIVTNKINFPEVSNAWLENAVENERKSEKSVHYVNNIIHFHCLFCLLGDDN